MGRLKKSDPFSITSSLRVEPENETASNRWLSKSGLENLKHESDAKCVAFCLFGFRPERSRRAAEQGHFDYAPVGHSAQED